MHEPLELEVVGPLSYTVTYTESKEDTGLVTYMMRGSHQGDHFIVCFVTFGEPLLLQHIEKNSQAHFEAVLDIAAEIIDGWREVPCFIATLQLEESDDIEDDSNNYSMLGNVEIHYTKETDLIKIADEVLAAMWVEEIQEIDSYTFLVRKFVKPDSNGFYHYEIQKEDSSYVFSMASTKPFIELDKDTLIQHEVLREAGGYLVNVDKTPMKDSHTQLDELDEGYSLRREEDDKKLYLAEVGSYLFADHSDNPYWAKSAFRSYYYYVELADKQSLDEDIEEIIESGYHVMEALLRHKLYDYAEWVCNCIVRHAEKTQKYDEASLGCRRGGIICEALGRIQPTSEYYERAIQYIDKVNDSWLKARIHMSYGISMVMLLNHCEVENIQIHNQASTLKEVLQIAERHLTIAQELLKEAKDNEQASLFLYTMSLYLIRVEDLKGQHESAREKYNELVLNESAPKKKLDSKKLSEFELNTVFNQVATQEIFGALILKKLASKDTNWRNMYHSSLVATQKHLSTLPYPPWWKCLWYTLIGESLLDDGQIEQGIQSLRQAYDIQLSYIDDQIRPPQPDHKYGGMLAIDLCSKLQHALIKQHFEQSQLDLETSFSSISIQGRLQRWLHRAPFLDFHSIRQRHHERWQALQVAEEAKGKFFKRDLAFLSFNLDPNLPSHLSYKGRRLLNEFVRRPSDRRITLVNYEFYCMNELSEKRDSEDSRKQLLPESRPLTSEDIQQILLNRSEKAALISLYATSQDTFVYLLNEPDQPPKCFILDISLEQLKRCVLKLR